jgi:2-iminobutanoate/2-iminopropanoate deaminase
MVRRPAVHDMITSRKAPKPIGPYSQAIRVKAAGEMLFVSGQIPLELPAGQVFTGEIKRQATLAFTHLKNIILDSGFSMDEVVKCNIYLTDMKNFDAVNEVYQKLFVGMTLPARAVVQVAGLPKGVGVEADAIAVKKRTEAVAEPEEEMDEYE